MVNHTPIIWKDGPNILVLRKLDDFVHAIVNKFIQLQNKYTDNITSDFARRKGQAVTQHNFTHAQGDQIWQIKN